MTSHRTFSCAIAYAVLVTLTISPLLSVSVPPLGDYPNHLARMWILAHGQEIPELAANYVPHWRLIPNLAMDLLVPPLAQIMPVETAGRLFIALTMLGLIGGTITLHRVLHGQVGFWPLCSLLFIYNLALFFGLLNFLFGVGAFLLAFSGWIATRHWPIIPRLLTFAAIASLLFTLHLFAFGLYGLSVMSYELQDRICHHRSSTHALISWCVTGLQFIPSVMLWFISLPNGGPTATTYGGVGAKILALLSPWSFGHLVALDGEFVILYLLFLASALPDRALKVAPPMRWPLLALSVAALLMPQWLNGSGAADIRLPVTIPFVFIASTRLDTSKLFAARSLAAAAVLLLAARVWAVSASWRDYDRQFTEFRAASAAIAPGARLLIVRQPIPETRLRIADVPSALALRSEQPYRYMAALAVIDRSAFIPLLFTGWTPVEPSPRNAGLFQTQGNTLTPEMLASSISASQMEERYQKLNELGEWPYWGDWPEHFDFVLWIDFGERPLQVPENLEPAASGSFFQIYRVLRS